MSVVRSLLADPIGRIAVAVILLALFGYLLVHFIIVHRSFRKEKFYIDQEIGRTIGSERQHWIRRKRRLYLSLIPFVPYPPRHRKK